MRPLRTSCLVSLFVAVAAPVRAEVAQPLEPGHIYFDMGGGAVWFNLPDQDGIIRGNLVGGNSTDEAASTEASDVGWMGFGTLGWMLPEDCFASNLLGEGTRIEVASSYAKVDGRENGQFVGQTSIVLPNGSAGESINLNTVGGPFEAFADYQSELVSVDLLIRGNSFENDSLRVTPLFGFAYSGLDQKYKFGLDGLQRYEIDDDLETTYLGGALGLDATIGLTEALSFVFGTRVDLLHADTDLSEVARGNAIAGSDTVNDDSLAARAGTHFGLTLSKDTVVLGLDAGAQYWSYMPIADHPRVVGERLRIDHDHGWTFHGRASVTLLF